MVSPIVSDERRGELQRPEEEEGEIVRDERDSELKKKRPWGELERMGSETQECARGRGEGGRINKRCPAVYFVTSRQWTTLLPYGPASSVAWIWKPNRHLISASFAWLL